jgi:hypothetical protein
VRCARRARGNRNSNNTSDPNARGRQISNGAGQGCPRGAVRWRP